MLHLLCTVTAEGALVGADVRIAVGREGGLTSLTGVAHLKRHPFFPLLPTLRKVFKVFVVAHISDWLRCSAFSARALARGWHFHRSAVLLRSKVRGAPSLARPLGGRKVHWTFLLSRLAPVPAPLRAQTERQAGLNKSPLADTGDLVSTFGYFHAVSSNSSRPISIRRISLVPAPIS